MPNFSSLRFNFPCTFIAREHSWLCADVKNLAEGGQHFIGKVLANAWHPLKLGRVFTPASSGIPFFSRRENLETLMTLALGSRSKALVEDSVGVVGNR